MRNQQLTSTKVLQSRASNLDPDYVPEQDGDVTWGENYISFQAEGKTWKINFQKE